MKILWCVNGMPNKLSLGYKGTPGNGFWVEGLIPFFESNSEHKLIVIFPAKVKHDFFFQDSGVDYYVIPIKKSSRHNKTIFRSLMRVVTPDIVNFWGTERDHSYDYKSVCDELNIQSVYFIQGLISEIKNNTRANLGFLQRLRYTTVRDLVKFDLFCLENFKYLKLAYKEERLLECGVNFIYENDWCYSHCFYSSIKSKGYRINLPINKMFFDSPQKVLKDKTDNPIIICNASGYPLKGLHIAIQALNILKKKYPTITLIVPGDPIYVNGGFFRKQLKPGYFNYITSLIDRYELTKNIIFTGKLTQKELIEVLLQADVFILTSALENHSSSVKEAMLLGVPCVSSYVGGVNEYTKDKDNVLHYPFGDYYMLAYYIERLISNCKLAYTISQNGRKTIMEDKKNILKNIFDEFIKCYNNILIGDSI